MDTDFYRGRLLVRLRHISFYKKIFCRITPNDQCLSGVVWKSLHTDTGMKSVKSLALLSYTVVFKSSDTLITCTPDCLNNYSYNLLPRFFVGGIVWSILTWINPICRWPKPFFSRVCGICCESGMVISPRNNAR